MTGIRHDLTPHILGQTELLPLSFSEQKVGYMLSKRAAGGGGGGGGGGRLASHVISQSDADRHKLLRSMIGMKYGDRPLSSDLIAEVGLAVRLQGGGRGRR